MAKKTPSKAKPGRSSHDEAPDSVPFTTRLTPRQKEYIEQAATAIGCSAAKFVRDAASLRAVGVLNSQGRNEIHLQTLAATIARQIVNPSVMYDMTYQYGDREVCTIDYATANSIDEYKPDGFERAESNPRPVRPHDSEIALLERALETSGVQFAEMLLAQIKAARSGSSEYLPTVHPSELLGDGSDE
ncbi:MAG: hypothetical protein ABL309_01765 [Phycisphaerales bacterium]